MNQNHEEKLWPRHTIYIKLIKFKKKKKKKKIEGNQNCKFDQILTKCNMRPRVDLEKGKLYKRETNPPKKEQKLKKKKKKKKKKKLKTIDQCKHETQPKEMILHRKRQTCKVPKQFYAPVCAQGGIQLNPSFIGGKKKKKKKPPAKKFGLKLAPNRKNT